MRRPRLGIIVTLTPLPSVHVTIRERLSLSLLRDNGGLASFDLRGDLDLRIHDPSLAHLRLHLAPSPSRITSLVSSPGTAKDLQFQQHPNVGKFGPGAAGEERVIALKNPERGFPVNQGVGVLRWRLTTKDESLVPINSMSRGRIGWIPRADPCAIAVNCWPSPRGDGKCDVNIEYELEATDMVLQDMKIMIPLPYVYPSKLTHPRSLFSLEPALSQASPPTLHPTPTTRSPPTSSGRPTKSPATAPRARSNSPSTCPATTSTHSTPSRSRSSRRRAWRACPSVGPSSSVSGRERRQSFRPRRCWRWSSLRSSRAWWDVKFCIGKGRMTFYP